LFCVRLLFHCSLRRERWYIPADSNILQ
jgi:hypothetical protein